MDCMIIHMWCKYGDILNQVQCFLHVVMFRSCLTSSESSYSLWFLCIIKIGKGWDVVRIHLLALHMISIADGQCIMQTKHHIFFPIHSKWSWKDFSTCMSRGGHQVNSIKAFSNKHQWYDKPGRFLKEDFFFLTRQLCVLLLPWHNHDAAAPQTTRNVLAFSSDGASWVWDEWWNDRAACLHSDAHYDPQRSGPPSGTY